MTLEPRATNDHTLASMKIQASADQGAESVKALAVMAGSYFRELVTQGFERHEAHDLVMQWQDAILEHIRPKID